MLTHRPPQRCRDGTSSAAVKALPEEIPAIQLAATTQTPEMSSAAKHFNTTLLPYVRTAEVQANLQLLQVAGAIHADWRPTPAVHPPSIAQWTPGVKPGPYGLNWRVRQDAFTVACAMSHRRIWARIVSEAWPVALVFEGDAHWVHPSHKPPFVVKAVLNLISQIDPQWDFINLGVNAPSMRMRLHIDHAFFLVH